MIIRNQKLITVMSIITVAVVALLIMPTYKASANGLVCGNGSYFGRPLCQSYYKNICVYGPPGGSPGCVIPNGAWNFWGDGYYDYLDSNGNPNQPAYDNVNSFINWVNDELNCIDTLDGSVSCATGTQGAASRLGAAFMISAMLGDYPAPGTKTDAQAIADAHNLEPQWASIIRQYDSAGRINWNQSIDVEPNQVSLLNPTGSSNPDYLNTWMSSLPTASDPNSLDAADGDNPTTGIDDYIVFTNPDGSSIIIRKLCGNITGNFTPLQVPSTTSNFNLSPTANPPILSPDNENPNKAQFSVGVDVNNTDIPPGVRAQLSFSFYVKHSNGNSNTPITTPGPITRVWTSTQKFTPSENLPSVSVGDSICEDVTISPATGTMDNSGNPISITDNSQSITSICTLVEAKPYFNIQGGDTAAGSLFDTKNGSCTAPSSATVSWNKDNSGGSSIFTGAGTSNASFATGPIDGFASGQNTSTSSGDGLSFANTTNNSPDSDTFGGKFGSAPCATDFRSQTTLSPSKTNSINVSSLGSGSAVYVPNSGATISTNGGNINPGQKTTIYIDGNLYINGDIQYVGTSGWNGASDIPNLTVVVCGNIYIDNSVKRLDGVYIAEPSTSGGATNTTACDTTAGITNSQGIIYTCVESASNDNNPPVANWYTDCSQSPLTVNGSFVAAGIQLERSYGTLSSNNPAEIFNYSPEEWLAGLSGSNSTSNCTPEGASCYDSITSLPPVL